MAFGFLPTPAAPPPSVHCPHLSSDCLLQLCHKQSRLWVEFLLLFGIFLSLFVHLASGRRYISGTWFRYPLWAAYLMITSLVSYTLGMMSNQPPALHSNLYFVWAILFVVIAYKLNGSISAFSLDDNETGLKMLLEQGMLTVYMVGVFPPRVGDDKKLYFNVSKWSLVAAFVWSILIYGETAYARMIASLSSKGMAYSVGAEIASYMEKEHLLPYNDSMDPSSMIGYRYLVDFMKGRKVTLENIWSCQGTVLKSGNPQKDEKRKDLCLSFAFFGLLLRRFGGYPLHEAGQDKTWRLVSENLLPDDGGEPERAFKVIEVELHFLYDFFYTKLCAVYVMGPLRLFNHFMLIASYITVTIASYKIHALKQDIEWEKDIGEVQFHGIDMDITVTWILLGTFVVLYIFQFFVNNTSIWTMVRLLCLYARRELYNNWIFEKVLEMILCIDWAMHRPNWERKLGQYSFLDSYAYVPWYESVCEASFMLFSIPRKGQREGKRIELSEQVKKAIGRSIKKNGHRLSNGVEALRGHGFNVERLSQVYPSSNITEHILTWHIATSLAAKDQNSAPSDVDWNDYVVAVRLSNYCAYLVSFAPELLPDHRRKAELKFDSMIKSANEILKGCGCDRELIFRRLKNTTADPDDDGTMALKQAALLAEELTHGHIESGQRWKMIAEFWAELLVYLAPSDNAKAHAEHLATGGEFITHIWALLTHAGIIKRENTPE